MPQSQYEKHGPTTCPSTTQQSKTWFNFVSISSNVIFQFENLRRQLPVRYECPEEFFCLCPSTFHAASTVMPVHSEKRFSAQCLKSQAMQAVHGGLMTISFGCFTTLRYSTGAPSCSQLFVACSSLCIERKLNDSSHTVLQRYNRSPLCAHFTSWCSCSMDGLRSI
jgi:hypothetical protein